MVLDHLSSVLIQHTISFFIILPKSFLESHPKGITYILDRAKTDIVSEPADSKPHTFVSSSTTEPLSPGLRIRNDQN